MNNKIIKIFNETKNSLKETKIYNGFGWCAYCTAKLSENLYRNDISNSIAIGRRLNTTPEGEHCRKALEQLIMNINDSDENYGEIKRNFIHRKHLPVNFGHAVILIDDVIYDITSDQFNLPIMYHRRVFLNIWQKVNKAKIIINESADYRDFKVRDIIYYN